MGDNGDICKNADGDGTQVVENVPMWSPDSLIKQKSNMETFRLLVNKKYNLCLRDYNDLYQWSVSEYPAFWEEIWDFVNIKHSVPYDMVVSRDAIISDIPEWFGGSRLNFAENLLQHTNDRVAIYSTVEGSEVVEKMTFSQLREAVAVYAAAITSLGIGRGDRVVGYVSNCPQAVVAMLAAASLGAIWSSTSPDFGVTGVLDRFSQIEPKLLFSVDCVVYNGKTHNHLEKLGKVVEGLVTLQQVVVISNKSQQERPDISNIGHSCFLDDFLISGLDQNGISPTLTFEQVPFNHPLFIMYSSGTTGPPKCMVHSVGGTLIQLKKEHVLHGNMTADDVMLYYTTTGWMMWNWLVSVLSVGAAIVLYDGSPLIPGPSVLWDLIDNIGVTVLGAGAKWISVLEAKGVKPIASHKLTSLHTILSTGSPLKPQSFDFIYRDVKKDVLLGSITGGTDIISLFAGHNVTLPVYRGQIQGRCLGMAMECWTDEGQPVMDRSGELVCTKPFPSMPTQFWNDPDGLKYRKAYFSKYKGVWSHGDFCLIDATTGGISMLGRSDGTLNPNGVRFGSAEIYNVVESFPEIQDSVCVAQRSRDLSEERVILFVKMTAAANPFSDRLTLDLKANIRKSLSARHVPAIILETKDIPYTQSGKKVEVAVRDVVSGKPVGHTAALANPESLQFYIDVPELREF